MNALDLVIAAQKAGRARGIPSLCSAHPWALRAAFEQAAQTESPVLIESTCNQVNQFGGYTGMTPAGFGRYVGEVATSSGFPLDQIIIGGDHLGPSVWQNEPESSAMPKAIKLVGDCVRAGYSKIHLDASMKLADDASDPLPIEVIALRCARLAQAAEMAYTEIVGDRPNQPAPRYVIGSEVPLPGGATTHEEEVRVTTVEDARGTIQATRDAFLQGGLEAAWGRVVAVVVQPGVEYGDDFVLDYRPEAAIALSRFIESDPQLVYETHSTDYQTRQALCNLVRDHFAILKVGPGLTFAFREGVFALSLMENELFVPEERSNLIDVLEFVMLANPAHWIRHYRAGETQHFARKYSFSDRSRYYWPDARLQSALQTLLSNLSARPLPLSLLSQYLPEQYSRIRQGLLPNQPQAILTDRVRAVLRDYAFACGDANA